MKTMRVFTIGVYGWTEAGFFRAIAEKNIDTFCDIRWRRGVRGAEYAFVNSARLQRRLARMKVRYLHFQELAPNPEIKHLQEAADKAAGIPRRQRSQLDQSFIRGYCEQVLTGFKSRDFVEQLGTGAQKVALFCVEREPGACHRSLLAERLHHDLGATIVHLVPHGTGLVPTVRKASH